MMSQPDSLRCLQCIKGLQNQKRNKKTSDLWIAAQWFMSLSTLISALARVLFSPILRFNFLRFICLAVFVAFLHDLFLREYYRGHGAYFFILALGPVTFLHHFAR